MSTLRHALALVRREPDCGGDNPSRVSHLRAGIADRYLAGATHPHHDDREHYLRGAVLLLARELETVTGLNAEPDTDSAITRLPLGDASVLVQWTRSEAEPDTGITDAIVIEAVFIGGTWTDPVDWASDAQMKRWVEGVEASMERERAMAEAA